MNFFAKNFTFDTLSMMVEILSCTNKKTNHVQPNATKKKHLKPKWKPQAKEETWTNSFATI